MAADDEQRQDDEQDDAQDDAQDDRQDERRAGTEAELEAIRNDPSNAHRTLTALRGEAMDYRRRLRKAEAELERAKTEGLSEQERAIAEAEQRGRDAATGEHGRRLLEAQVRAAAAGKLQDPGDAVRYLELDALLELDEGDRELGKAIDKLLEDKPYLAVANGAAPARTGAQSQGARTRPGGTKATDADGDAWLRSTARRR